MALESKSLKISARELIKGARMNSCCRDIIMPFLQNADAMDPEIARNREIKSRAISSAK